jgi:hypothetical protein
MAIVVSYIVSDYKIRQFKKFLKERMGLSASEEVLKEFLEEHPDVLVHILHYNDPSDFDTYDRENIIHALVSKFLGKQREWPSNSDVGSGRVDMEQFITELHDMAKAQGWRPLPRKEATA